MIFCAAEPMGAHDNKLTSQSYVLVTAVIMLKKRKQQQQNYIMGGFQYGLFIPHNIMIIIM